MMVQQKLEHCVRPLFVQVLSSVIDLGIGTSFNIKDLYPNDYMNFTKDNFMCESTGISGRTYASSTGGDWSGVFASIGGVNKSYDATTGILSASCSGNLGYVGLNGAWAYGIGGVSGGVHAYLIK